jgi:hypothetical protein
MEVSNIPGSNRRTPDPPAVLSDGSAIVVLVWVLASNLLSLRGLTGNLRARSAHFIETIFHA